MKTSGLRDLLEGNNYEFNFLNSFRTAEIICFTLGESRPPKKYFMPSSFSNLHQVLLKMPLVIFLLSVELVVTSTRFSLPDDDYVSTQMFSLSMWWLILYVNMADPQHPQTGYNVILDVYSGDVLGWE